ncbi:MAG: hypothetical protein OXG15_14510 [Gammaproteobacteria bacterium]|nr:hypothetical protein [Gammaproteobacteria bacterium]
MSYRWYVFATCAVLFTGCGGGSGTEPVTPPPEPPVEVTYVINVTAAPEAVAVRVGGEAEATITWRFTSSATNPTSTSYSVTSPTEGVQITAGTGTSLPNNEISTSLRYECTSVETVVAQLIVRVGSATQNVDWEINCTGQRITIESIDPSIASSGFEAQTSLIWRYESEGEEPAELSYTVTTDNELVTVTPSEGSALPDESITVDLLFTCQTTGEVSIELTTSVGTASQVTTWVVTCTEEAISVEIPPERAVVSIGDMAESELSWQYSSTGGEAREISYLTSADIEGVTISDTTGNALPESTVTHQLGYLCESQGVIEIRLTVAVGSDSQVITWVIECTEETIEIVGSPLASHISVGESDSRELLWRFTSTSVSEHSFGYSVVTNNPSVQVIGGEGVSLPDVEISTQLIYVCESLEDVHVNILITVGNAMATTSWRLVCSEETVVADQELPGSSVSVGSNAEASFTWQVETTGIQTRVFSYAIESQNEFVEIEPSHGQVVPNVAIESKLIYACAESGQVDISITIDVGSVSHPMTWRVECTEEQIDIVLSPPELVIVSFGTSASTEVRWQVQSSATQERLLPFIVSSATPGIQIMSATGSVAPGTEVETVVDYECREIGTTNANIVINVGNASHELTWSIECSQETIEIVAKPQPISVSVGEIAKSGFRWHATTTSENLNELDYLIKSNLDELIVEQDAGQVAPDEIIETNIMFECDVQAQLVFEIAIEVGSARHEMTWNVECTLESIEFTFDPLPLSIVEVGQTAMVELNWLLHSTAFAEREFEYEVSSGSSSVQISDPTGKTTPDESITNDISYVCLELGEFDFAITVSAESINAVTSWSVECSVQYIALLTVPTQQKIPVGDSVIADLTWEYRSPSTMKEVSYEISSSTRGLQILNSAGTVLPNTAVSSRLRYPCSARRNVTITLQISAGDVLRDLSWQIECAGEDLTQFVASFYQGPQIGVFRFEAKEDRWTYSVVEDPDGESQDTLEFRTNRQVFVEIQTEHDELVPLPISVHLDVGMSGFSIDQIRDVETKVNESEDGFRYTSTFLFDIPAIVFKSPSVLRIHIDRESLYPELDESNNRASFTFDASNTLDLSKFKVTFVPIRTQDGVPDLSDIEVYVQPLYELMPVGTIDVSIGEELDASDLSWTLDTSRTILDRLYDLHLSKADSDSYYQGIVRRPEEQEVSLCGNAFLDSTVSITVEQCSPNIGAHELGHNFDLKHAPACGAENTNVDMDYPYPAGDIGIETGWLMQQKQFIDGSAPREFVQLEYRYYDIMSYCPETFTSRYSYGKALDYLNRKFRVLASRPPSEPIAAGYAKVLNRSVVVSGTVLTDFELELRQIMLVGLAPLPSHSVVSDYSIRVIHGSSGTVIHREPLRILRPAHTADDDLSWGARIPYFDSDDLHVNIVEEHGQVVLDIDLDRHLREWAQ